MRRAPAAVGSAVFFAVAPGAVAVLIPWWITGWESRDWPPGALSWASAPLRILGAALALAGVVVLIQAFTRFVVEGFGTPVPIAPTEHLVVGGVYRYVRNPMYVAIFATVAGQALIFGSLALVLYGVVMAVPPVAFVRWYEEPVLRRRFGEEYDRYRAAVPGWWPRLHAYRP
ncbi:methyltransferase family protein [Streptosporangium sp. KLBMP 9127]|nr:isoprenylcysteine carboxylmethyltransferase family protein [Streptosporangium sp. KLBMP 9127]